MSFLSWLASAPPDAAIEIAPDGVSIAVLGSRGQEAVVQGYGSAEYAGDLAGLRSMDAQQIVDGAAAQGFFPFFVIDRRILPRQVVDVFDRGEQVRHLVGRPAEHHAVDVSEVALTGIEVLDATVGPLLGTTAVSGCTISTSSLSMPRASAAICAKTVLVPWPISVLAARTRT